MNQTVCNRCERGYDERDEVLVCDYDLPRDAPGQVRGYCPECAAVLLAAGHEQPKPQEAARW